MRKDRFNKAFNYLKGIGKIKTQKEAASIIGVDTGNLSNALKGIDKYLTNSFIYKFNEAFGDMFNSEWIITGEGEMLKPSSAQTNAGNNKDNNVSISVDIINISEAEKLQTRISELEEKVAELTEKLVQEKERTIQILLNQSKQ